MADFLIEQAEKWSASIERGFNLWEADKVLLVELLKA